MCCTIKFPTSSLFSREILFLKRYFAFKKHKNDNCLLFRHKTSNNEHLLNSEYILVKLALLQLFAIDAVSKFYLQDLTKNRIGINSEKRIKGEDNSQILFST